MLWKVTQARDLNSNHNNFKKPFDMIISKRSRELETTLIHIEKASK